jgi:flagellar export protein FliJ
LSTLETLARVARRQAEEIERELAALEGRRRMVRSRIAAHDQALAREGELARADTDGAVAFGAYAQAALAQRRMMAAEEAALAGEAETLRDSLRDAFIELKKIELLIAQRAERAAAEEEKQEQAALDDVAATMMRGKA